MKILYLVPHVPHPTKVRSYLQLRGLVEAGHQVTVATLARTPKDRAQVQRLEAMGIPVLSVSLSRFQMLANAGRAFLRGQPLQARLLWSGALMAQIQQRLLAHPVDMIHVEHLRMAAYGLRLLDQGPVVWDAVDSLTSLFQQATLASRSGVWKLLGRLEAPRLSRYEPWLTTRFPATLVISSRDKAIFQDASPVPERIHLAPFGTPVTDPLPPAQRAANRLVLTGSMNYHPNVASAHYFVREILPLVWRTHPDVQVQLVGANPLPSIQQLASERIEVTGFVESVTDYLRQATLALAPVTYGSGIQIKVIEALLTETPLVATSMATRGLELVHGRHALLADTPEDFAAAIDTLLSDPALRARLAAEGRRFVEENHDLRHTTANLIGIYEGVLATAR